MYFPVISSAGILRSPDCEPLSQPGKVTFACADVLKQRDQPGCAPRVTIGGEISFFVEWSRQLRRPNV